MTYHHGICSSILQLPPVTYDSVGDSAKQFANLQSLDVSNQREIRPGSLLVVEHDPILRPV